jgi:hypothetical protein
MADGSASTATPDAPAAERSTGGGAPPARRPLHLALAGIHLRLGAHDLARAELEAAAGDGSLDADALLDLAEIRWRTGDLPGAGVAANAYLGTGRDHPLGFVIAAESAGAAGHTLEARRLASRALAALRVPLDDVYAGIPQGHFWPIEPDRHQPVPSLFAPEAVPIAIAVAPAGAEDEVADHIGASPGSESEGLWPERDLAQIAPVTPVTPVASLAPAAPIADPAALADARAALDAGDHDAATDRLVALLRERPDLAATVLGALSGSQPDRRPTTPPDPAPGPDAPGAEVTADQSAPPDVHQHRPPGDDPQTPPDQHQHTQEGP